MNRQHLFRTPILGISPFAASSAIAVALVLAAAAQMPESGTHRRQISAPSRLGNAAMAKHFSSSAAATSTPSQPLLSHRAPSKDDLFAPLLPFFLPIVAYQGGAGARAVAVADLNHDGHPDVVFASNTGLDVLLGNGDGTLQTAVMYDPGGLFAIDVKVADVNGDGKLDVVVVNQCAKGDGTCLGNPPLGVLLGNGDGTLQPVVIYDSGGSFTGSLAIADVNGDGKPDLIVAYCQRCSASAGGVGVLLGNGDGTFEPAVTYPSGGLGTFAVTVADLNTDNRPDIIVTNWCTQYCATGVAEGSVGILLGNGDGTFQASVTYDPLEFSPSAIVAVDLNADGKQDLAVTGCTSDGFNCFASVSILLGKGDGTFQLPAHNYPASLGNFVSLAVADVNEDGKLDLAMPGELLLGNGDGTFQPPQTNAYSNENGLLLVDMNGDNKPDVVAAGLCDVSCANEGVQVQLHVGDVPTTITLTSAPNPAVYGQETFTATVGSGSGTPTGTVKFYNESFQGEIGSATLAGGTATVSGASLGALGVGTDPIVVAYQGSVTHHPSLSSVLDQTITKATTTTSVAPSVNPASVGVPVIYTVTVASQYGGSTVPGVTCLDNGSSLQSLGANDPLQFKKKYTTAGTHTIACSFVGDDNNFGSTAPNLIEHVLYPTKTVLTTSGSPSHVGQPVTFTAKVASTYGVIPNGELVTFSAGKKVLGTAPVSGGSAALTTSSLAKGNHNIVASYPGDASFNTSHGSVKQVVAP